MMVNDQPDTAETLQAAADEIVAWFVETLKQQRAEALRRIDEFEARAELAPISPNVRENIGARLFDGLAQAAKEINS